MYEIIYWIPIIIIILIALTFHEAAHAYTADLLGDSTPRMHGRLTLNPFAHLDLIGTLCLILSQMIGWAKPVPINPYNFRNPSRDMALTAAAGPLTNLTIAFFIGTLFRLGIIHPADDLAQILSPAMSINIVLAIFNLIPIPPLDGSRVLMHFLPAEYKYSYGKLEQYGMFILLFVIIFGRGLIWAIIYPFLKIFCYLFTGGIITL